GGVPTVGDVAEGSQTITSFGSEAHFSGNPCEKPGNNLPQGLPRDYPDIRVPNCAGIERYITFGVVFLKTRGRQLTADSAKINVGPPVRCSAMRAGEGRGRGSPWTSVS